MAGLGLMIGFFFSWAGNTNLVIHHPWLVSWRLFSPYWLLDSDERARMLVASSAGQLEPSISGSANPSSV